MAARLRQVLDWAALVARLRGNGCLRTKRKSLSLIAKYGWSPDLIVDVGAANGSAGLFKVWPEVPAILIEPKPDAALLLKQNARPIDRVIEDFATSNGTTTIDKVLAAAPQSPRRILLKIDVDGAECDVVAGAKETLTGRDCVVIVECALHDRKQARLLDNCIAMREYGYELFDLLESLYRPNDGVLWQVDCVFVMADSIFRTRFAYQGD